MRAPTAVAVALFAGLLVTLPLAQADDAFMNNGAYGPEPRGAIRGEESVVRLESEQIMVRFGRKQSTVAARFVFRSRRTRATTSCDVSPIPLSMFRKPFMYG